MSRRVTAIIAAAGVGKRLGADMPKAYVELGGRTLVERSIRAMIRSEIVDEILVVISPAMRDFATNLLEKVGLLSAEVPIKLVDGGAERFDSVWCALQAIPEEHGVVLVHDAARALTPPGMIARVSRAVLEGCDAVVPVVPIADTIKQVADGVVVATPPRSELAAVQTPQGFDLATLRAANLQYFEQRPENFSPTDDASLIEWAGNSVHCVQGDPMALKVTTPLDFALARVLTEEAESTEFEVPGE
ncbi:2-C-methyl-D-erythritol 4-phosphate cytidylyltransferase [Corynebacterium gerontici]|uniref:2-C-methyl-D-erythritol 4-phosphate cytidylyltransferase n=1 Tax=Corynebacterium gerontici TaxID=2079234 RepID=A0A3G6IYF2_9CORY|nr:2-C-methyl-D-erythritol 4-phosphate cytidylyltransferase [Corynebacterium gerontici]AZA10686.1 2-C-methyl-D-erythritol 4-phosphate cytidylyltransferase [Corynebacterium gerontici]